MYALISWGGVVPNQRPRTALAYVYTKDEKWFADILISKIEDYGKSKYKRPKRIERSDILHEFGNELPYGHQVVVAKHALPKVSEDDPRFFVGVKS